MLSRPTSRLFARKAYVHSRGPLFETILIANRGEIACRVIRTARRLGIRTVAIYSEADAEALHVSMADEAICVGPPESAKSYLNKERIIAAAKKSGAQAIHPGYGFLSENAAFAQMCEDSGVVFIGPPASAIRSMGSKSESKIIMSGAGVPVVPGYWGEDQSVAVLSAAAKKIGFPVLLKPVHGGGGKGMRVVRAESEVAEAVESTRRLAASAFSSDRVLLEKYIERPRHIELQVFADKHGNAVHLFERDCSVQRRHQKVLEEAPAPLMDPAWRADMGAKAVAAARAVNYVGAGTVEFIVDGRDYYFMEMNTRLQVEHPVTEMVVRKDLVELQIMVAAGRPLPFKQEDVTAHGHAVEARVYAENPRKGFLPGPGRVVHHRPPPASETVRVDTGIASGDTISVHYDPMISKLICWGEDRDTALHNLKSALDAYQVVGPPTNIDFVRRVIQHPDFVTVAGLETGFIEKHAAELTAAPADPSQTMLALSVLALVLRDQRRATQDPWSATDSWRSSHSFARTLEFDLSEKRVAVGVTNLPNGVYRFKLASGVEVLAHGTLSANGALEARVDSVSAHATVVSHGDTLHVFGPRGEHTSLTVPPPAFLEELATAGKEKGSLLSPMPGKITKIFVQAGDAVVADQLLMIMEAMKMEHSIRAPAAGKVEAINFKVGDNVANDVPLIKLFDATAAAKSDKKGGKAKSV